MKNDHLLSIGEASKLLGVSIQTLRRWDAKGTLKSFRADAGSNRLYRKEDLNLFLNDLAALGWRWVSDVVPYEPKGKFYCSNKGDWDRGLKRFVNDLQETGNLGIDASLLALIVGEIGDNSYAHNLGNWPDILGIFFAYDLNKREVILADRGRGVLETLKLVRPTLLSHKEALKVAFTEIVSGRFPERRGNGLKSVARSILGSDIKMVYRTGDAQLDLKRGDEGPNITECETFRGCYVVIKF